MNKLQVWTFLVQVVLWCVSYGQSQTYFWEPANGTFGGTVSSIASAENGRVYFGTRVNGIFCSSDFGNTWVQSFPGPRYDIFGLITKPGGNVFAVTFFREGAFRSTDYGRSWMSINTGFSHRYLYDVCMDSSGRLFIACWAGPPYVYRSTDNGNNWTGIGAGIPIDLKSIAAASNGWMFSSGDAGVFASTNIGLNWTLKLSATSAPSVAVKPGGYVFACVLGVIVYSTDYGMTWQAQTTANVNRFCISPQGEILAATIGRGILKSTNNGTTWFEINNGISERRFWSVHVMENNYYYAGSDSGKILRSTDHGATWTHLNPGGLTAMNNISTLFSGGDSVFAGATDGRVFVTRDHGRNWSEFFTGYNINQVLSMAKNTNSHFFVGTLGGGVFRTIDNGVNWVEFNNGLSVLDVRSLTVTSQGDLIAGTLGGGIFRSTSPQTNWTLSSSGLTDLNVYCVQSSSGQIVLAGTSTGVYKSTNNGLTWASSSGSIGTAAIQSLAFSPTGFIFAGLSNGNPAIYLSSDNGQTWAPSLQFPPGSSTTVYSMVANSAGHIYAASAVSVYRTTNNGNSWQDFYSEQGSNITRGAAITRDQVVFIGGYSGVYRSTQPTVSVDDQSTAYPEGFFLEQNYPNPFNPKTTIVYGLPSSSHVNLSVFNMLGQMIAQLVSENQDAGHHQVEFIGDGLSSGIYFYRLQAGGLVQTKKLLLLR